MFSKAKLQIPFRFRTPQLDLQATQSPPRVGLRPPKMVFSESYWYGVSRLALLTGSGIFIIIFYIAQPHLQALMAMGRGIFDYIVGRSLLRYLYVTLVIFSASVFASIMLVVAIWRAPVVSATEGMQNGYGDQHVLWMAIHEKRARRKYSML
jgi:hypothetical protein